MTGKQILEQALRGVEKRAVGLSDAGPNSGFNLRPDAPLTGGPRTFQSANVENKGGNDFFSTSLARQAGVAPGVPGRPAIAPAMVRPAPTTTAAAKPAAGQQQAGAAINWMTGGSLEEKARQLQTAHPGARQVSGTFEQGQLVQSQAGPTQPAVDAARTTGTANPMGASAATNTPSTAGTEQLSEDLPTPEQVQAAQTANTPASAQPQAGPLPTAEQMRANRNMPESPVPPATTQPPARQSAEAPPTNAVAEVPISEPKPEQQYRDTPRYANPQDAMKALDDPNLDEAGRREAAGTIVSSQMANIPAEDRAMFRQIANGENGPEQQAFLAKGFDRFQQEQATEAVKTNPELATNPEAFGSFMGQVQGMWEGLGPVGQIASMIGIPAAVFGMMGGDGMSAILGGLGLGALGIGAGAMGYLGEGTQRNMGQMLGQVGNFFGVIPDEARNASILTGNNDAAKQRIRAAMESAPAGQGFAAGQQALDAERAKFEPLKQLYETRPELAHTMMMGMEGDAPKTPAEAEAIYQQLRQQYDETGREGYLQQQAYDEGARQVSEVQNALPAWARVAAGVAAPYMPESVRGYAQDIGGDPAAVARRHVDQRFGGTPELVKANAAQAIWRRHVVKQALNAVDQKELNDLEQWQKTTKVFDEKKVQRLKELQARQASEFSADKVVKVCMKAARCWAGYEAVPGAKAYSRGSCRPVGSKKTQKEMKNGTERQHEKVKQSGAQSRPQVTNRTTQGARAFTAARLGAARR